MTAIRLYTRRIATAFVRTARDYWSEPLNVGFSIVTLFIAICALVLGGFFGSVSPLKLSCPDGFETERYFIKCDRTDYDRRRLNFNKLAESSPEIAYRTILLRDRVKDVDLRPNFPPVVWRIRRLISGLTRPVFANTFSWRTRLV